MIQFSVSISQKSFWMMVLGLSLRQIQILTLGFWWCSERYIWYTSSPRERNAYWLGYTVFIIRKPRFHSPSAWPETAAEHRRGNFKSWTLGQRQMLQSHSSHGIARVGVQAWTHSWASPGVPPEAQQLNLCVKLEGAVLAPWDDCQRTFQAWKGTQAIQETAPHESDLLIKEVTSSIQWTLRSS